MRGLRENVKCQPGSLWVAGALALMLSCAPAVALAEEDAGAEAPAALNSIALTQDAGEQDAEAAIADGGTDLATVVMSNSNDADAPDVVADDAGDDEPSGGDGDDPTDEPADPDPVQPAEPIVAGLKAVGDRFQYVNDDGTLVRSDWKTVDGKRYYFDADGTSVRWSQKIDGNWYYFDRACEMQTGWITWSADGLKSYFGPDGKAWLGWQKLDGRWYYFSASGGKSVRWSQKIGGKWYYFNGASQMHTGLLTWSADGLKSCFGPDGAQLYGWQKVDGRWYYFSPSGGKSVRWSQKIGGKWYYFNGASQMHTGWLKWNGKQQWSYYDGDGVRLGGTQTIGGYEYTFDKDGRTATAPITRPYAEYAMEKKAQNYSSSTNYLILVNRSTHKVGVFYWRAGYWEMTAYWDCVTGKPSTPTITGSFKTTGGKRSSLSTDSRAKYCTQITGGYFFHTILASNNELGKSLSHGCIRLSYSSAKWIYQHIHAGTRVVIY